MCPDGQFPCEGGTGVCYPALERCNNQKRCPDGSDEKNCYECQPGNFHCGTNLCIFETWRCDGQEDCLDGSDERDCPAAVPRKVITAALIGSLVCSLLLVIALGCALKLHSLRSREYRWGPSVVYLSTTLFYICVFYDVLLFCTESFETCSMFIIALYVLFFSVSEHLRLR